MNLPPPPLPLQADIGNFCGGKKLYLLLSHTVKLRMLILPIWIVILSVKFQNCILIILQKAPPPPSPGKFKLEALLPCRIHLTKAHGCLRDCSYCENNFCLLVKKMSIYLGELVKILTGMSCHFLGVEIWPYVIFGGCRKSELFFWICENQCHF